MGTQTSVPAGLQRQANSASYARQTDMQALHCTSSLLRSSSPVRMTNHPSGHAQEPSGAQSPRGDPEVAHLDLFGRRLDTEPKRRTCQRSMARPSKRFTVRSLRCFVSGALVPLVFDASSFPWGTCSACTICFASGSWLLPPDPSCNPDLSLALA